MLRIYEIVVRSKPFVYEYDHANTSVKTSFRIPPNATKEESDIASDIARFLYEAESAGMPFGDVDRGLKKKGFHLTGNSDSRAMRILPYTKDDRRLDYMRINDLTETDAKRAAELGTMTASEVVGFCVYLDKNGNALNDLLQQDKEQHNKKQYPRNIEGSENYDDVQVF